MDKLDAEGLPTPQKKRPHLKPSSSLTHLKTTEGRWTNTGCCRHRKKNKTSESDKVIYGYVLKQTDGQTQEAVGTRRKMRPLTDKVKTDGQT